MYNAVSRLAYYMLVPITNSADPRHEVFHGYVGKVLLDQPPVDVNLAKRWYYLHQAHSPHIVHHRIDL